MTEGDVEGSFLNLLVMSRVTNIKHSQTNEKSNICDKTNNPNNAPTMNKPVNSTTMDKLAYPHADVLIDQQTFTVQRYSMASLRAGCLDSDNRFYSSNFNTVNIN